MYQGKLVLMLCLFACCVSYSQASQAGFNQTVIDLAMKKSALSYKNGVGTAPSVVSAAQAWYYLALVSSLNPNAVSSEGKKVKDRVISTFRNVVTGGNEPHCGYPLYGWSDGPVAMSLALIKKSTHLWSALTGTEQAKADWLMKALAITGNWGFNDENDFATGLGMEGDFRKSNNPNFVQGYMGAFIAAAIYYGPDEVDNIFAKFDYDTYINQFNSYGWINIVRNWTATGKTLMEQGGSDGLGGSGKGVRVPFKWNGYTLNDLNGIFYSQSVTGAPKPMYCKTVVDSVGSAGLISGSSPVLGQFGMCMEFNTADSKGLRSDAQYAFLGWMGNLGARALLKRFGLWGGPNVAAVESLMMVGTTDLIYKLEQGYQGVTTHGSMLVNDQSGGVIDGKGYPFLKDIWLNYIN